MLDAFCLEQQKGFFAFDAWGEFAEEEIRNFTWYCCPEQHTKVIPYKKHLRNDRWIISHFKVKANEDAQCKYGESEWHLAAKTLIATVLELKDTRFFDGYGISLSPAQFDFEKPKIEFRWEKAKRRTDVMLPLRNFHPMYGKGISFEIQLSKITDEEKQKRVEDWRKQGFSVSWLEKHAFYYDGRQIIGVANPILITDPYALDALQILKESAKLEEKLGDINNKFNSLTKLTYALQNFCGKLLNLSVSCCANCDYSNIDRRYLHILNCWYEYENQKAKKPKIVKWDNYCSNFSKTENNEKTNKKFKAIVNEYIK